MRRRLATTLLVVIALASAGVVFGTALDEHKESRAGASGAMMLGQYFGTTGLADRPGVGLLVWHGVGGVGGVDAGALPRTDRGTTTTYAYFEREGADAFRHRARGGGPGVLPSGEAQPAPATTNYAVVPGSASPARASPITAIAVLFASTLGGLSVLLRRQRIGRREI
jgi:hypothetical protein